MGRSILTLVVSRGLGSAIQALTLVLLAHKVNPSTFGTVGVALSIAAVGCVVLDLGLTPYVARAQAQSDGEVVVSALRLNRFTGAAAAAAVVAAGTPLTMLGLIPLSLPLIGLALVLEKNLECRLSVLVAQARMAPVTVSILLRRGVTLGAFLAGTSALKADPSVSFAAGLFMGSVAGMVHASFVVRPGPDSPRISGPTILRASRPFMVASVSAQARQVDVGVVSLVLGSHAAGLYSIGSRIASPFTLVAVALGNVLLPRSAASPELMRSTFVVRFLGVLALLEAVMFGVAQFSEDLVCLLLGSAYTPGSTALFWTLLSLVPVAAATPLGSLLQGVGRERFVARNGVVFSVVALSAVALGSVLGGIAGAALAALIAYSLKLVMLILKIARFPSTEPVLEH